MLDFSRSIIESKQLFSRHFYIKRDDLIHPYCNGNKARKFASLLKKSPYSTWISYGGNQSNAMFALSYLAHIQGVVFKYIMPSFSQTPSGNLAYALKWGMQAYTLPQGTSIQSLALYAKSLLTPQALLIPQGGTYELSLPGMHSLADELSSSIGGNPVVFYTSGSGVGVITLQKALRALFPKATLVAINCAGSEAELRDKARAYGVGQMEILSSPFAFAKPKSAIWEMRAYLKQFHLRCDLVYDSPAFCVIYEHLNDFRGKELVFIHSGGLTGDISQQKRYSPALRQIKATFDSI